MSVRGVSALACILLLSLAFVPPVPADPTDGGAQVEVGNFYFDPEEVTIDAGDAVTWTFVSGTHNVEPEDGGDEWCPFMSSGNCSKTFDVAGTYAYRCGAHSSMEGTVIVLGIPPVLTITAPTQDAELQGTVVASGTASHPLGLTTVEWRVGSGAFQTVDSFGAGAWSTTIDTTLLPNGLATLSVRATGDDGGTSTAEVGVRVANPAVNDLVLVALDGGVGLVGAPIEVGVRNDGNVALTGVEVSVEYEYLGTWRPIHTFSIALGAGMGTTLAMTWQGDGKVGSFDIRATIDPADEVAEVDEGDNQAVAAAGFVTGAVPGFDPFEPV